MGQVHRHASRFVRAAALDELTESGGLAVNADGHVIALFRTPHGVFAVNNRCPHMGFPLNRPPSAIASSATGQRGRCAGRRVPALGCRRPRDARGARPCDAARRP